MSNAGRYAPSPSGDLHFGNLRTAALAWLCARSTGRKFLLRVEDIDSQRSVAGAAERQLNDLADIGLDWDGDVTYQSDRLALYESALADLEERGLTYECYCTRKDIREATSAPHATPGIYPGTCRDLTDEQRERRRAETAGRAASIRVRADTTSFTVTDLYAGQYEGVVDDFLLRRGGEITQAQDFAYNFVVVVDDGQASVDQVVRGDDLLSSAPRQAWLAQTLGYRVPEYVHVPLVLGPEGKRLAKRDGPVTLREMGPVGQTVRQLCASIGYPEAATLREVLAGFDPRRVPREPVAWRGDGGAEAGRAQE